MVSFWTSAWGRETSAAALEQRGVLLSHSCGRGTTGHVPSVAVMGDTEGSMARTKGCRAWRSLSYLCWVQKGQMQQLERIQYETAATSLAGR